MLNWGHFLLQSGAPTWPIASFLGLRDEDGPSWSLAKDFPNPCLGLS